MLAYVFKVPVKYFDVLLTCVLYNAERIQYFLFTTPWKAELMHALLFKNKVQIRRYLVGLLKLRFQEQKHHIYYEAGRKSLFYCAPDLTAL